MASSNEGRINGSKTDPKFDIDAINDLDRELPEVDRPQAKAQAQKPRKRTPKKPPVKAGSPAVEKEAEVNPSKGEVKSVNAPAPEAATARLFEQLVETTDLVGQSQALILLTLLDGVAAVMLGDDAKMTDAERALIEEPLKRIFAKMGPAALGTISQWSDPVTVVFGLVLWGTRLYSLRKPPKPEVEEDLIKGQAPGEVIRTPGPEAPGEDRPEPGDLPPVPVDISSVLGLSL